MKVSNKGLDLIMKYEGCRLNAYKPIPTEKHWTIGYGHYGADVKEGMKISHSQAISLLLKDVKRFERAINMLDRTWTQNEFDALASFAFNCGESNLYKLVSNRNHNQIADAFLLYNKAGGKVLNGLTKRRREERELFMKGYREIPKDIEYEQIAKEVIDGKWGNGKVRKDKLTNAGYDYNAVQTLVNKMITGN